MKDVTKLKELLTELLRQYPDVHGYDNTLGGIRMFEFGPDSRGNGEPPRLCHYCKNSPLMLLCVPKRIDIHSGHILHLVGRELCSLSKDPDEDVRASSSIYLYALEDDERVNHIGEWFLRLVEIREYTAFV